MMMYAFIKFSFIQISELFSIIIVLYSKLIFVRYSFLYYKIKSEISQMIAPLELTVDDQLRRTRLFSLAEQLRSLQERIKSIDVEIRQTSKNITKKLLSVQQFFQKKGQEDAELKKDSEYKLLVNWIDNFATSYKISQNPNGQVSKIILEVLLRTAGDFESFGFVQVFQLGSKLSQLAETYPAASDKKSLQEKTRQALNLRFILGENFLKCTESLKILKQIEREINTSSSLFENKNTKILRQILKDIFWDDHITEIMNKIKQVTDQMVEEKIIKLDLDAPYVDFEVENPKLVKIITSDPARVKAREQLKKHLTDQRSQRKQVQSKTNESACKIEYGGETAYVKDSVFGLWETYQKVNV